MTDTSVNHAAATPKAPSMAGRFIRLRPLTREDIPPLYEIAITDEVNVRWRFRGVLPSFEAFAAAFHPADVTAQFAITTRDSQSARGMAVAYNTDPRSSHTYVGTMLAQELVGSGCGIEATLLFTQYLFMTWPFRKVYFEVIDYNLPQFESALGRLIVVEGALREHLYYDGQYRDVTLLAAYREPILEFCRSRVGSQEK